MNRLIAWTLDNAIHLGVLIWFVSSLFELGGIVFTAKHDASETKVSIETPVKEQKPKDSSTPSTEEGPKASW